MANLVKVTKREKKRNAFFLEEIAEKKGDYLLSRENFNRHNAKLLMILEIHEALEAGSISHVHEDNSHSLEHGGQGVEVIDLETGEKVLCLPTDCTYDDWREVYDQLKPAKVIKEKN